MHLDPIRYHHLYMYLAHRSATVKELAKVFQPNILSKKVVISCFQVTRQLFQWELQMHGNTKLEVVKCWRLHLGASNLTGMVINSVADEKTLASRCEVPMQLVKIPRFSPSFKWLHFFNNSPGNLLPCAKHVPKRTTMGFQQSLWWH